ncbi:MAG: NADPH2:quinone reductase [Cellvibrionaceae bacterium]|jgi:NADPH2:quinone reductase
MKIKSIGLSKTGPAELMHLQEVELDAPRRNEVIVRNHAVGINFIDIYFRSGLYPLDLPSGLGMEAAGIVEAVGPEVSRVKLGDRVVYVKGPLGAYAEAHKLPESSMIILPDAIDFKLAAAMMLKGLTAAYLLLRTFPLQPEHTLLVHAAAGGTGSILTQWAKDIGARVIGTVGREEKVGLARRQGCDEVLLYRQVDVAKAVRKLTDQKGVDVVYDSVGKDTFMSSLDSLKRRGTMVSFGNASGAVEDFRPLMLSQKGSLYLTRPTLADYIVDPDEQQALADALFDQVLNRGLVVNINHEFPLAKAVEAHKTLESGLTTGSIILTV